MDKVIIQAGELDDSLTAEDKTNLQNMNTLFSRALDIFPDVQEGKKDAQESLIAVYNDMGDLLQEICRKNPRIHVYSFVSPKEDQSEASRVIAKLRDVNTNKNEFIYYIQRAYEMLFKLAWISSSSKKNHLIIKTPVNIPAQNYAVHKIADIDDKICNTVMCVMLRGALLPSMIMSKEIEAYSSNGYITPFALFRIYRNDKKHENDMEYTLDLDKSFFNSDSLNGKDLVFADPMNATSGSLITIVKYLLKIGVKPRSIIFLNVIAALKGVLRVVRTIENCDVYTLWMDGVLNDKAYIMPGLGDAGDRINGHDAEESPRNIIQLLTDYGADILDLYRSQFREIEKIVLNR
jgi:uracil phosphoribosyltransferase